jgi:Fic family protein
MTFSLDLTGHHPNLWMMLGECRSKCEHIAHVPLSPETAEELLQLFMAKGILGTTAIEGNTLSEEEVRGHLSGDLDLPASRAYLQQEIANVLEGCNALLANIRNTESPELTRDLICWMNTTVLTGLEVPEGVVAGEIRKHAVTVGRYLAVPAEQCEDLLNELCDWLNGPDFKPQTPDQRIVYAIIKSVIAHLYLAWIHPFGDGNGRTARLLEFYIQLSTGIPMVSAHILSNHYNQTRVEYYRQLDRASGQEEHGRPIAFLSYAIEGFPDGLKDQLHVVRGQQLDIAWHDYVHNFFRGSSSAPDERRRRLVLDLSKRMEPVSFGDLPDLSPAVARLYADLTPRKSARGEGYRANEKRLLSFMPFQRPEST